MPLLYESLEKLAPPGPVDRLNFLAGACREKVVLDIGCYDETALIKVDTAHWLHGRIAAVARQVIGVDNSAKIPEEGLRTAANAMIHRGNGADPDLPDAYAAAVQVIVAGEFIESPLAFLHALKVKFPGRELLLSTPNGGQFANTLMGVFGREVQHHDHLQVFTYKILNTLCLRAGLSEWQIIPYRFYATEMILTSTGAKQLAARAVQGFIRLVERCFPLLSFGYIVRARL